jgi:hypothetical protein
MRHSLFWMARALAFVICLSACAPANQTESATEPATFPTINAENWIVIANDERVGFFEGTVQTLENPASFFSVERRENFLRFSQNDYMVVVQSGPKLILDRGYKTVRCQFAKRENPVGNDLWVGDAYFLNPGSEVSISVQTNQPVGVCKMFPQ